MSDSPASPRVAILMGSKSDWPTMKLAAEILDKLGVPCESRVLSAHRKPARLVEYINEAQSRGVQVFIAGAGGAAHLAGVIAAHTTRPVLGVPIKTSMSGGLDSLLSTVQMPRGIPVGTLATGEAGATNAGILAAQILGTSDETIAANVAAHRKTQAEALGESPD